MAKLPSESSEVWVVRGECADYYCGCGGVSHLLAVTTSEGRAVALAEEAKSKPRVGIVLGKPMEHSPFLDVGVKGPFSMDELIEKAFEV